MVCLLFNTAWHFGNDFFTLTRAVKIACILRRYDKKTATRILIIMANSMQANNLH